MPVSFSRAGKSSNDLPGGLPALATLLEHWPSTTVRDLDSNLKGDVAAALKARQVPGGHADEDKGEIATVFYATVRRDLDERFAIVTDDNYGKQLARDRGFDILTTPALTLQMVCAEAFSEAEGKRVWQQATGRQKWKEFESALARERASF